jgi:hypothetical protein
MRLIYSFLGIVSLIIGIAACTSTPKDDYDPNTSYWSVNQFIIDQYRIRVGDSLAVTKTVYLNGKSDTTYIRFDEVDWTTIFKVFGAADISHPKFYNRYTFDHFEDNFLKNGSLVYTAKDQDLFVQKLNVSYDTYTQGVQFVYIETLKDDWLRSKEQKLSYYVGKKIVIQEEEKSFFGGDKELIVTYEF